MPVLFTEERGLHQERDEKLIKTVLKWEKLLAAVFMTHAIWSTMKMNEAHFNITQMSRMFLFHLWSFKSVHQFNDSLQIILRWPIILPFCHNDLCQLLSAAQWGCSCILRGWIGRAAVAQRPSVFIFFTRIAILFHLPRVQHLQQWQSFTALKGIKNQPYGRD